MLNIEEHVTHIRVNDQINHLNDQLKQHVFPKQHRKIIGVTLLLDSAKAVNDDENLTND